MNGGLSLAIPCRADEPGLGATLKSLYAACQYPLLPEKLVRELTICINGLEPGVECAPILAVRAFCAEHGIPLQERWIARPDESVPEGDFSTAYARTDATDQPRDAGEAVSRRHAAIPYCSVLLTERRGKPPAWNVLWRSAAGGLVLFCDADVRLDPAAIWLLYARLRQEDSLLLVAAREIPVLERGGTLWGRIGAISYRFDFGNAGGRLLMLRKGALSDDMPEDLLLEDAWLTVAVGRARVAKEWQALVYFLPPATGRDYFAEKVRTEGGKLQIRRAYGHLLQNGPIAAYRWSRFLREISVAEYPLVLVALVVRGLAYCWARLALVNKEFYALYRPFLTTKDWSRT